MAESMVFSLASTILSKIASPVFEKAYGKGISIWEARDELAKLRVTIETIQVVLVDAEKKEQGSASVNNWIKRLKDVLYDAEDLFDEVATEDLIKQQMLEGKKKLPLKNQVKVYCSRINPISSRNSISEKVKAIRKNLVDISTDMAHYQFVRCQHEKQMFDSRVGQDPGCFVDAKDVVGRDEDKKTILKMLSNEADSAKSNNLVVVAVVGIGGMGKTTLAQLIYNDEEIRNDFTDRWFVCISDTSNDREVLGKIFRSITGESCNDLDVGQLQTKIRRTIEGKKYILVLDNVWDDDRGRWHDRMSLLSSGAIGSKVIVTTRLPSVAKVVGSQGAHILQGLSNDDSWSLFKRFACDEEFENDPRRKSLGRKILKKCSGVPLAIRSIGSLLYLKNTILEWEAIEKENLPMLGRHYNDETMRVLKLSYDHLPSHLKQCFAYCCLFPKDYEFSKKDLINHWIAQGYIESNDEESGFMLLLRRGFFQDAEEDECGEIKICKMHDLMHDLATYVGGEESTLLRNTLSSASCRARNVSISFFEPDESWDISVISQMHNAQSLRSLLLNGRSRYRIETSKLDQLFTRVKLLRVLSLSQLGIKNIPRSIGELKLIRYLDLSCNSFEELPHSITDLVNLLSLNLGRCQNFRVWPLNFNRLTNLMYLNIECCKELSSMPVGIGDLTRLQYLSDFIIEKGNSEISKCLNESAALLQQLRGNLRMKAFGSIYGGSYDHKLIWQLPVSLQSLNFEGYMGRRIPGWGNNGSTSNLARLKLLNCDNVKYLPPLRCLPNLRWLEVGQLLELEFMEEGDYTDHNLATSKFFPRLVELCLWFLPKLNRWWGKVEETVSSSTLVEFPLLRKLSVNDCPKLELRSFPLCPHVRVLNLYAQRFATTPPPHVICNWQFSLASLQELRIYKYSTLKSLHLASPHLQTIWVQECSQLTSIEVAVGNRLQKIRVEFCKELQSIELVESHSTSPTLPTPSSIQYLTIESCEKLKDLHISAHLISSLEKLQIVDCLNLRLAEPLPSSTALAETVLRKVGGELIKQLSSLPVQTVLIYGCIWPLRFQGSPFTSLRSFDISAADGLETLNLAASHHLRKLCIVGCRGLTFVEVEAPASIAIARCPKLKNLGIACPGAVEELLIVGCPELGVKWESFVNLRRLQLSPLPPVEELHQCLVKHRALGQLLIEDW